MAASSSQSSLPQGFSVYQPALGAQLQFFPALGSQQLDDLINAYVPGPAAMSEKRASVSVDFLEYAQLTGQTFKFYPVYAAASVAASPIAASPSLDSANSSFNVSPVTSSWDWSAAASVSSRSSTQRRRHSKATSPSRHQTAIDFSSLPGMKILTKDGVDVTNSASRGSKTKEQRDHAHLMRIIKACDSCKRKKIRCDPSHKKRAAAQASAQPAATGVADPKPSKKQRTLPQSQPPPQTQSSVPPPALVVDEFASFSGPFDLDSSFDFSGLEALSEAALPCDPWEEFVQFPPMDVTDDYDFFLDPENYFSSQSSASSSSASPFKALTPQSQEEPVAPPGGHNGGDEILQTRSPQPQYPFLDQSGSSGSDYADFNLFSPQSSFSEDDRMLPISSSSSSLPSLGEPLVSEYAPPGYDVLGGGDGAVGGWDAAIASAEVLQFSSGDVGSRGDVGGIDYYDPGLQPREPSNHVDSSGVEQTLSPAVSLGGQVVICCAPGTVVLTPDGPGSRILDNVSTSPNVSGSGLARSAASEPSAHLVSQPGRIASPIGHHSESPAVAVQDYVAATAASAHGHDQSSVNVLHQQDLRERRACHRSEAVPSYGTESGCQGSDAGGERVTDSHATTSSPGRVTVSHAAPTRESFVELLVAESPGQPGTSRGVEARSFSLASPGVLQTTSVDRLVDSDVDRIVARSSDQNHSATQQSVETMMPSGVVSAGEGAVDLNGLPSVHSAINSAINSATSNPTHASDQWSTLTASVDAPSLETRLISLAAVDRANAAQSSSRSAPGGLGLALLAMAILSGFVLYVHSQLTSASTSAYILSALLVFASKATASAAITPTPPATASRQTKQQSLSIKSNSSRFSDILDLPGRTLAAVRSDVSRSISQGSAGAFPVMTSLKG